LEERNHVKANRIGANEQLSTRFIWMAAKETDRIVSFPTTFIESEGTSLKTALDIARKYGVVKDSSCHSNQASYMRVIQRVSMPKLPNSRSPVILIWVRIK
jgi:hypothetical protein